MEAKSMLISFSQGKQLVCIGDKFKWWDLNEYEVISFSGNTGIYSPSGLGGTLGVIIKNLTTGTCDEWCADSVASGIHDNKIN